MPFIDLKTTVKITEDKEKELIREFGEKIALLPGKTEDWLMLNFTDGCRMAFRGTTEPDIAYIEVKLLGASTDEAYENLTAAITETVSKTLNVPSDRIYVKYEEISTWGYNGANF
jgi:phenylpyruvate tautomerase PptA (4-oxalocrotonate tautomerase family)